MSSSIIGFGLEKSKQISILFRAIYTYWSPEIYTLEEIWEFYHAKSENTASYLWAQQRNSNHKKGYVIFFFSYVAIQNIKSNTEKEQDPENKYCGNSHSFFR